MRNQKPSFSVRVRHSADCPDKGKGNFWQDCQCWKSYVLYGVGKDKWESASTRSWTQAVRIAKERLEDFDPKVIRIKQLEAAAAAKTAKTISIRDAITAYIEDGRTRQLAAGTLRGIRQFENRLFAWINQQKNKPEYLTDVSADTLAAWRNSWKLSANTASLSWIVTKGFFSFCVSREWLPSNPAAKLKSLRKSKVNNTAIFSDDQYAAILAAVDSCTNQFHTANLKNWRHRLLAFVELLRWGGCDLSDAIQFRPDQIRDGVFRYNRQKTKVLATIPIPEHVIALLRNLPLVTDSVGTGQPFRTKDIALESDVRKWEANLTQLFEKAGIKTVVTASGGTKKPHAKMFRHTCAVSHLIHGSSLLAVSKYLGHASPEITAKVYLPFVAELENAVIAEGRKSMAAASPKPKTGSAVLEMRRKRQA
jgi:integrase